MKPMEHHEKTVFTNHGNRRSEEIQAKFKINIFNDVIEDSVPNLKDRDNHPDVRTH